ncbi:MAG TPA: cation-efflux pump [Anaerolineales bacterium]
MTETRDVAQIRRVLVATMVLNFLTTIVKLAAGLSTGALSVVADGLDSLFDGISNVVGLIGFAISAKPPDANYPYGRRKFETLATLSIAFLLFLTSWQLLLSAWQRLGSGMEAKVNLWTGAAMGFSMFVQLVTSLYELRQGRRLNSEFLVADAMHTRASILISLSVLAGLALVRLGVHEADPILAAFVALAIAKIGVDVLRETLPVLVDQAAMNPERIAEVVEDIGGIESFHRVRSRGAAGSAAVDLHVRVSPEKSVQEANAIADEVRRRLLALGGVSDVTVHIEAQHEPGANGAELFATIKHAAGEMGLIVHEAWAHRIAGDLYVEMHIGVDPSLTLGDAHAQADRLEQVVRQRLPEVKGVHTHIEEATTQVQVSSRPPKELEARVRRALEQFGGALAAVLGQDWFPV